MSTGIKRFKKVDPNSKLFEKLSRSLLDTISDLLSFNGMSIPQPKSFGDDKDALEEDMKKVRQDFQSATKKLNSCQ